jgi:predicted AAA+ superfamily ATPase
VRLKLKAEKIYIERELETKIKKYLKRKEIIAIVGARQCGKTTLMKHIFNALTNAKFISFDDINVLEMFNHDTELFVRNYIEGTRFLFIDEFQYAKEGGKKLKYIYDNYSTKIIISGSSVAELSIQSIKYLVGRIFVFTLCPLSFGEFLRFKNDLLYNAAKGSRLSKVSIGMAARLYEEFLVFGGYPSVALSNEKEEKIEIIRNIYNTYILREIKEILQISEDEKLIKLIKALSLQAGGLANYNELSLITGFDYKELISHLGVLKKTYICLECRPYFRNKRKELVKAPKFYFLDNGFRNIAINNFQGTPDRTDLGALYENFASSEFFKMGLNLNYWRTKAGAEVDFIVEHKGKIIPVEVKSFLNSPKIGKSLMSFAADYKAESCFVLSKDYKHEMKAGNLKVSFLPIFLIFVIFKSE